jgi:hypothetical protein
MQQVATLSIIDADSGDEAVVIVRCASGLVSVAFSLKDDGDIELTFTRDACQEVIRAMERALAQAE